MLGKICGRCVMPEKYDLYKSDAGAEIVFKVDEINDGVYLSDLNAYLITVGVEETRNKYLLSKSKENRVLSLSFAVNKLVTSKSGNVTAQIVFESAGGEVVYHTMLFYISVKNSVSGYAEPSEPLPSAITSLQNSLTATIEQCKELKNDYLAGAEEYRSEKALIDAEIDKLNAPCELVEKIITGYSVLETEPEDFTSNYANYYKTNGKARNDKDFNYVALTEAEAFTAGKYYSKGTEASNIIRTEKPDGTQYLFKSLYVYGETKDKSTYFSGYGHFRAYVNRSNRDIFFYFPKAGEYKSNKGQGFFDAEGNVVTGGTAVLSSEPYGTTGSELQRFIFDENVTLTGFSVNAPAESTFLIYGVRK